MKNTHPGKLENIILVPVLHMNMAHTEKIMLDLKEYHPIQCPSVCNNGVKSPDENMKPHSEMTTKLGSSSSQSTP
jgi:hypothetical protein